MNTKTVQAKRLPATAFLFVSETKTGIATARQEESLVVVTFTDGTFVELRKKDRASYAPVPQGATCKKDAEHGAMRVTLKSTYCVTCDRALQVAYLAKKKAGLPTTIVAARQAEQMEKVERLSTIVPPSRERLTQAALIGAARSGEAVKGSDERKATYSAARYTATARELGLTVEQANALTGLAFVATTWVTFQALAPEVQEEVEAA